MSGLTSTQFWSRVNAARRVAEIKGARFPEDTPAARATRRARALLYPEYFNTTYLPHYFRQGAAPFHAEIYRAMLRHRRLCVRAPRGHAKSTILTFAWPVHQVACAVPLEALAHGRLHLVDPALADAVDQLVAEDPDCIIPPWEPYLQVIAVTEDLAAEFTASIQADLTNNDLLRSDWTGLQDVKEGQDVADWVINNIRVKAFGMLSGIRGGKHGPYRPSRALLDDPDSKRTVATLGLRDAQEATLSAEVEMGLEPDTGAITVAATKLHVDCLAARLENKERYPEWEVMVYRAWRDDGEPLWPGRFSAAALTRMQTARPEYFAQEMMDAPVVEGGRPFTTLHRYQRAAFADMPLGKVLALDPALGRTEKSDFQALVVLRGPTPEGWILVHRAELLRIGDPLQLVRRVNQIVEEEQPDACVIETIGFQVLLKVLLSSDSQARVLLHGWLEIRRQEQSKDLRIRGTAPLINEGIVRFPADQTTAAGERQFTEYPSGKKDFPDVVEMALRQLRTPAKTFADIRHVPGRADELGRWF